MLTNLGKNMSNLVSLLEEQMCQHIGEKKELSKTLASNQVQGHFPTQVSYRISVNGVVPFSGMIMARREANGVLEFAQTTRQSRLGNFGERV